MSLWLRRSSAPSGATKMSKMFWTLQTSFAPHFEQRTVARKRPISQCLRTTFEVAVIPAIEGSPAMPNLSRVCRAGRCDCSTMRIISSFSNAGYLILRLLHPQSCFFEQTVLQRQVSHALLQRTGFATMILHFAAGFSTGGIASRTTLASSMNSFDQV